MVACIRTVRGLHQEEVRLHTSHLASSIILLLYICILYIRRTYDEYILTLEPFQLSGARFFVFFCPCEANTAFQRVIIRMTMCCEGSHYSKKVHLLQRLFNI